MTTTVKALRLKLNLSNGSTSMITLPEPINANLYDDDHNSLLTDARFNAIKEAFATDAGDTIESISISTITTATANVVDDWAGGPEPAPYDDSPGE